LIKLFVQKEQNNIVFFHSSWSTLLGYCFSKKMKLFVLFILFFSIQLSSSQRSKDVGEVVTSIITSDWLNSMMSSVNPIMGPILEGIFLILSIFMESESAMMERYFRKILDRLDEIDSRLDQMEESVSEINTI
jgi:hypothetical protein